MFGSSLFKNYKTLFITKGPENCNKFEMVAKIPAKIKLNPKYFWNDCNNLFPEDEGRL